MSIGIYSHNFYFEYRERAKAFECFKCKLVSPKNYIIECKHCICQLCSKSCKICEIDKTFIILNGKNQNAFQYNIINNLLSSFIIKCIFANCDYIETYGNFINKHYPQCKFKNGEKLKAEYFENILEKKDTNSSVKSKQKSNKDYKKNMDKGNNKKIGYQKEEIIYLDEDSEQNSERKDANSKKLIYDESGEEDNNISFLTKKRNIEPKKFFFYE